MPDGVPGFVIMPYSDIAAALAANVQVILLEAAVDESIASRTMAAAERGAKPLMVITLQAAAAFEIAMLRAGADACSVLPIPPDLLAARLDALIGRHDGAETELRCGDLRIDLLSRTVSRDGRRIDLLPREYALLLHLARHGGTPVARRKLLAEVWRLNNDPGTNVVQAHVSRLRAKVDRAFAFPLIHCSKGIGYSLSVTAPRTGRTI